MIKFYKLILLLINLAGTPPTTVNASTFLVTTAPAATIAPLPILQFGSITAFAPIQTSSLIIISLTLELK